ncbi:hypothetical protein GCM10011519_33150 [Marmoricola endophyticus]|uniref:SAF domain-containing protein n=1 Tax=Marmoricola endophyticus TaxID=2040280 RepID=A0A917BS25_9ACTN|nr:hypothetical protein [Marmoricola endophyticus]GGF56623.1 hypothetical protein GCM10011519_33150 [Marmoricola endophyticus]
MNDSTTSPNRSAGAAVAPTASRPRRQGWRDPRLLVGVLIVAVSVLLGVRVLASADDTVAVWAATKDLPSGTEVGRGDLVSRQLRFTRSEDADRYLSADEALPSDRVLGRAVGSGELLPRAALDDSSDELVEVPLAVEVDAVPATVREGSVVDVWVTPDAASAAGAGGRLTEAERILDDVTVVRAARVEDTLAPSGTRQIIVGVTQSQADELGPALGRSAAGHVVITRQA